jgi:hypothetical protein
MRSGVSKSGGNASLAGEKKVWRSLNGHESESWKQIKADLKPPFRSTPEGRVSIARWNLKGLRRSIGP